MVKQNKQQVASRGAAVPAAPEAGEGDAAKRQDAVPEIQTPPLTNRGCLTPRPVVFHLDYLKVTIFAPMEEVRRIVENALLEKAGIACEEWIDVGTGVRWEHIYGGPGGVVILVPKDKRIEYCMVEAKGEGCQRLGPEAIQAFLRYLKDCALRWQGRRVDLAFDRVAFGPAEVDAAIRRGDINSRCLGVEDRGWANSPSGSTAYLGRRDQKKDRRLRVYDKRGYNRCEAEFRGDWAASVVRKLSEVPYEEWPKLATEYLRGMVDFVDSKANERIERCPLLRWWAELVGDAGKIVNLSEEDRRQKAEEGKILAIGKSEVRVSRASLSLWPVLEAFGEKYLIKRLREKAEGRVRPEEREFAEELKEYRRSGLAGLPRGGGDDTPF